MMPIIDWVPNCTRTCGMPAGRLYFGVVVFDAEDTDQPGGSTNGLTTRSCLSS